MACKNCKCEPDGTTQYDNPLRDALKYQQELARSLSITQSRLDRADRKLDLISTIFNDLSNDELEEDEALSAIDAVMAGGDYKERTSYE